MSREEPIATVMADSQWTCGLCNLAGTPVSGVGEASLYEHMQAHVSGQADLLPPAELKVSIEEEL